MSSAFPDRSERIFGREPDIAYLLDRSRRPGITAVVGRPQIGKSWLLLELSRRLLQSAGPADSPVDVPHLLAPPACLVGFFELQTDTSDFLLRAVVDLYSRWLSDSTYWQQAQVVYQEQKKDLVGKTGEAFGALFEALSRLGAKPLEVVGGLVKRAFEKLAQANRDLQYGATQLPRLQIDQARELLELMYKVTNTPLVLIFDQWDKSLEIEKDAGILDSFIRHIDEWPACHIFIGMRPDEKPRAAIKQLQGGFRGIVESYDLPPMHLDNAGSRITLLQFLRERVPAAADIADVDLLDAISGYPGTLAQWTNDYYASRLHTLQDFRKAAADANIHHFAEFETLLPNLSDNERRLSMRLVLLPASGDADDWPVLRPLVMEGVQTKDLDRLKRSGVIEVFSPPTYGHAKRTEAALQWFLDNCYGELSEICELLIFVLGSQIQRVEPREFPYVRSLVNLDPVASRLELPRLALGACQAALSLVAPQTIDQETLLAPAEDSIAQNSARRHVIPLVAYSLVNALSVAKREDQALDRRTSFLDRLRRLFAAYPDVEAVREQFAIALFNSSVDATEENDLHRRDILLDELRRLCTAYPKDKVTREHLAKCLFNKLLWARDQMPLNLCYGILDELRQLSANDPDDLAVRENLAKALFNAMLGTAVMSALDSRDQLLDELRCLYVAYPEDDAMCRQVSKGLFNALNVAQQERAFDRRDALLEELQQLYKSHTGDAAVRELLANGLSNTLVAAIQERAPGRANELLGELRLFADNDPEDVHVRESFAIGLFHHVVFAEGEDASDRRQILLLELWKLWNAYPSDTAVLHLLAMALFNAIPGVHKETVSGRRDELLAELWRLSVFYPNDGIVRKHLHEALYNVFVYAREEKAVDRRNALLDVLRQLSKDDPQNAALRELVAQAVFDVLHNANQEAIPERETLLEELRQLHRIDPESPKMRQRLADGLVRTMLFAEQDNAVDVRDASRAELGSCSPHFQGMIVYGHSSTLSRERYVTTPRAHRSGLAISGRRAGPCAKSPQTHPRSSRTATGRTAETE
jgi:hypothetical protein